MAMCWGICLASLTSAKERAWLETTSFSSSSSSSSAAGAASAEAAAAAAAAAVRRRLSLLQRCSPLREATSAFMRRHLHLHQQPLGLQIQSSLIFSRVQHCAYRTHFMFTQYFILLPMGSETFKASFLSSSSSSSASAGASSELASTARMLLPSLLRQGVGSALHRVRQQKANLRLLVQMRSLFL